MNDLVLNLGCRGGESKNLPKKHAEGARRPEKTRNPDAFFISSDVKRVCYRSGLGDIGAEMPEELLHPGKVA